jgi:hypothetical protein
MLGREFNIPAAVMFHPLQSEANEEEGESSADVDRYVWEMKAKMRKAHDIARTTLKAAQQVMKRDYDVMCAK